MCIWHHRRCTKISSVRKSANARVRIFYAYENFCDYSTWIGDHPRTPRGEGSLVQSKHMQKPRPQVGKVFQSHHRNATQFNVSKCDGSQEENLPMQSSPYDQTPVFFASGSMIVHGHGDQQNFAHAACVSFTWVCRRYQVLSQVLWTELDRAWMQAIMTSIESWVDLPNARI